ncbi:peptide chain release factor 1-like, mitochondrial [Uloborus diversus]|uniref:peptide chain release factor 1-like, mitochondrial n=1 Tax=Uloborus diversus TaxID=327109 RepID=UPI00240A60FF|nr:peptide chain release factor 1-like, mitochondrial [Uloborus diversus]
MPLIRMKSIHYAVKLFSRRAFVAPKGKNINTGISACAEKGLDIFQSDLYEDIRLQKHIKLLKDRYIQSHAQAVPKAGEHIYGNELLHKMMSVINSIEQLNSELRELLVFIKELEEKKDELLSTALLEKKNLENSLEHLKIKVLHFLIPDEIVDDKDIILELSAGVGGQEAMLFTKTMFDMYCRYAQWKNWSFEILKFDTTDIGGLRTGHIAICGSNAFKVMKYECGVHRVQRVPKTERAGRIHTSTMTVAVLPQPSEIDIVIEPKDIELEFKRSSGAGGQHVNTTDSCVRITHKATGIVTESQMERNQHRNRELALKALRAKLYERELQSFTQETKSNRKLQIGTAARSEKVRTYNYPQDRITDHRAHINMFDIELFFQGEEHFDQLLKKLETWNQVQSLHEILNKYDAN